MNATTKLLRTSQDTGRFCAGEVVFSITDTLDYFPELTQFAKPYLNEIDIYRQGLFPTTPKEPTPMADIYNMKSGSFARLPKQYRRFFARVGNGYGSGWRSFKGFDPHLGYKIAHGKINIRRGADSPWGMKWLSGQVYTSILTLAIHAEHVRRFGELAPLPLPIVVTDIQRIYWDEQLQEIEKINLGGNRNYLWSPDNTEYCRSTRRKVVQTWIDALPDTTLSQAICEWIHPAADGFEGLGGVVYDMHPHLRLEMPVFFSPSNTFQHSNYALALEKPESEISEITETTLAFIQSHLGVDSQELAQARAENLGKLIGICRELKINVLSFGVEASNIAVDGSLPDLDTIQYRRDSIEWMSRGDFLPYTVDFRYTGIRDNLQTFEAVKAANNCPRLENGILEDRLRQGLHSVIGGTYKANPVNQTKIDPTLVMERLDHTLTVSNTIRYRYLPRYLVSLEMPWPEGFTFLRCKGMGNNPAEVWFTLAMVGEFAALEVHHRDNEGKYQRLPGDYFHESLDQLPRSFLDYIEEYIRLFLNSGIFDVIFYPEHIIEGKGALIDEVSAHP